MPRHPGKTITDEDFVSAYQKAETTADVARKFNVTSRLVINRASRLRRRGVPLKKMPNDRGRRGPEYVQALVKLAQKTAPKA